MIKKLGQAASALAVAGSLALLGWILSTPAPPTPPPAPRDSTQCAAYVAAWEAGVRPGDDGFAVHYLRLRADADLRVAAAANRAATEFVHHVIDDTIDGPAAEADGLALVYACRAAYTGETD